jgi:transcriptional regulator with XRE-family HTH domain
MQADLTSEQLRAARAVLGYSVVYVAEATEIGSATLKRYEASDGVPKTRKGHLGTLKRFYEAAGIEFIGTPDDAPGIRFHGAPGDTKSDQDERPKA